MYKQIVSPSLWLIFNQKINAHQSLQMGYWNWRARNESAEICLGRAGSGQSSMSGSSS
jgi:hypothetical protein